MRTPNGPGVPGPGHLLQVANRLRGFPYRRCARLAGVRWSHIAGCMALALATTIADAAMLALLVPLGSAIGGAKLDSFWQSSLIGRILPHPNGLAAAFLWLAALMFALALVKNVFAYALHTVLGRLRTNCMYRLGNALFERYLSFGKAWFDHTNVGQMATIIDYRQDVAGALHTALRALSTMMLVAGYLFVMALISWRLTLVALLLFPAVNLASHAILNRTALSAARAKEASMQLSKQVHDALAMMTLYQSAGMEKAILRDFSDSGERLRANNRRIWQLQGLSMRIQDLTALASLALMLVLAFQVERGRAAQPALLLVFFFIARLSLPMLAFFADAILEIAERLPRCRELLRVFDDGDKFAVHGGRREFAGLRQSIRLDRLTFAYPDGAPALRDVCIELRQGRVTAVVGPTGAGKSTIANLLMRFYDVPAGMVLIDGIDIREYAVGSLRRQLALVTPETMILSGTLRSNLMFGIERTIPDGEMASVIRDARLEDVVALLPGGLDGVIGEMGATLSSGQRQRVAIARALLRKPSVLLLDEATSGLDAITERLVGEAVANAMRQSTALVIAHRFTTIERADHVIVLDEGRVADQGSVAELLERKGLFYRMWQQAYGTANAT